MDLTFEQQVIVAVVGGVVASILTSILNNWAAGRRLRDQWEREKEERREQWQREQEARRREWKREYRAGLLRAYLEKVDRVAAAAGMLVLHTELSSDVPDKMRPRWDRLMQLSEEIISTGTTGIEDAVFHQLQREFGEVIGSLVPAVGVEPFNDVTEYTFQLDGIAHKLHKRAEELLEETFD